ncbi:methyl-accepting chemotaxis protein [Methanosphaerula palustris]|uniref:Methyl-accepting chemotaxis sensory transducer with Pas/Pac sensor n=1 Tax=Methanosphaerula palustris (strain ATCC BAA-1556 / DSM 19958 / E1-9c) TaxID=521011 RepID=B8GF95_METPE|nr:methyl-accepting chemotaxis protein [Methanosphaerula palustris]ACL17901.1 methyl-accepting chemotaxis sensory transducer with Pas/Pac sensor [Methanosphaerula palustris E1-9c]
MDLEQCTKDLEIAKKMAGQFELLSTGINQLPVPIHIIDTTYTILYTNEAAAGIVGKRREEVIGKKCFDLYRSSACNTPECPCRVAMEKGIPYHTEIPLGETIIDGTGLPLKDSAGTIIGAIEYFPDVTEQKKAVTDILWVAEQAENGVLSARTDPSQHTGDFQKMAVGINGILDAVIGPLNIAADFVAKISAGMAPEKITANYQGDFNVLMHNLNQQIDVIVMRNTELDMLIEAAIEGKLTTRADPSKFQGGNKKMMEGVNAMLDAIIAPLNVAIDYYNKIGIGDIPEKRTNKVNGDIIEMQRSINNCIDNINALVTDANMLSVAAVEGKLATRADATKHQGDYRKIIEGFNQTLDAVITPLNLAAECIDRISKGDIPDKTNRQLNGDFNTLHINLNNLIDNINALVTDANLLAEAAIEGKLANRADTTRHLGDYKKVIGGFNRTLDSVTEPVNEAMRVSNEFAKYNFTARVDKNLKVAGDFIAFKDALDGIGISISTAMKGISVQMTDLAASAEEANASVEEVVSGAQQVAGSTGKVSSNAELGNHGLEQVLKAMEDLSAAVEEVTASTESVATLANNANTISKDGAELARKAEQGMVGITRSTNEVDQIIGEIKSEMQMIGKIVGLISDLANQTNLLALNAAIEAARAGDAGRGFAVVAAEVKSLAQESRTSAESIADMIGGLQHKSELAAKATASASKEVGVGSAVLSETLNVFNRIVADVEKITRSVEEVASASEEQAATVEEITASVHEVSSLVDGTASEAGDAAAASEETSAAIDEVGKIIENVNVIVDKVSREISIFRV